MKLNKGFTLIELLVVIAIIGILSSVVLASLTTARTKGQDAAVEQQLSSMRAQAELYYSSNNSSYGAATNDCTANMFGSTGTGGLSALVAGVTAVSGSGNVKCNSTAGANGGWAVSASLPSNPTTNPYFCVDSTGKAVAQATQQASGDITCD